jgi:hypothetical protein
MEEIWKKHPKIDERYEFSNLGHFKSLEAQQEEKTFEKDKGKLVTYLKTRNSEELNRFFLHRIVAELFLPVPDIKEKIYIKHIDEDKFNNNVSNLEWITEAELVRIDILRQNIEASNKQKLSVDDIIQLRNEFEITDININDMAKTRGITAADLAKILKYETFQTIQPELKKTYRINKLLGQDYDEFYDLKLNYKTSNLFKVKKVSVETKISRRYESVNFITKDAFEPIYFDYVNSGLEDKELLVKYNIVIGQLTHNIKLHPAPSITYLENEEVIPFRGYFVTTHGRLFNATKTRILSLNVAKAKNTNRKIINLLGENFLELDTTKRIKPLDGNPLNFKLSNLEVTLLPSKVVLSEEMITAIKYDYANTTLLQKAIAEKYGTSTTSVNKILSDTKKKAICTKCGCDNPEEFLKHKGLKKCDCCIDDSPQNYRNLSDEAKKIKSENQK